MMGSLFEFSIKVQIGLDFNPFETTCDFMIMEDRD